MEQKKVVERARGKSKNIKIKVMSFSHNLYDVT